MKIILDNIIYSKAKNGGVSNYWFELSKYLLNEKIDDLKFIQEDKNLLNYHRNQLQIETENIINNQRIYSKFSRITPIYFNSNEKFIYHSSYYRNLIGSKNKIEITTVYDFIHNYHTKKVNKFLHNYIKYNAIRRSNGIICISKNTYSDLKRFCPIKQSQKAEVIYVGVSDDFFPIETLTNNHIDFLKNKKLEKDYLIFVGARTNYKNFDFVANILNENNDLKLVIVGGGNLTIEEVKLFNLESYKRIKHIPAVSNSELNLLFNCALALIYPSSIEGFGIPIIEAMKANCPVIGLDTPISKEVGGEAILTVNKLTNNEFNRIKNQIKNNDFRKKIIDIGIENSKKYSWGKCSKETKEFYESLYY